MNRDEFIWVEKYRPTTVEDCILPQDIKNTFLEFIKMGEVPNLLLAGPAGCGKTRWSESALPVQPGPLRPWPPGPDNAQTAAG